MSCNTPDFFELGFLEEFVNRWGHGIRSTVNLKSSQYNRIRLGQIGGEFLTEEFVTSPFISPEILAYCVQLNNGDYINMKKHWSGKINHCPPDNANVMISDHGIFLIKNISIGDELLWDYNVDYWVFQLTHMDIDDWRQKYPSSIVIWEDMHLRVSDYSNLLVLHLYQYQPNYNKIMNLVTKELEKNK